MALLAEIKDLIMFVENYILVQGGTKTLRPSKLKPRKPSSKKDFLVAGEIEKGNKLA